MVKKRSRTSRKNYESEEAETDSDYGDDPAYNPAPKKYSLRQRKRAIFMDDFDYDDDGVQIPPKASSDDEEFHVEKEPAVDEAPSSEYVAPTTYINAVEPEQSEIPTGTDELVDFEDMIRADIVVNKNRIDYDNVIQKTEIKVQASDDKPTISPSIVAQPSKSKNKRGRKPKRRNSDMDEGHFLAPLIQEDENDEHYHPYKPKRERKQKKRAEGEIDSSLLEPETEVQEDEYEDKDDADYNPNDDLEYVDIANCMQTEFNEYPLENINQGITNTRNADVATDKHIILNKNISVRVNESTEAVTKVIPEGTESSNRTTKSMVTVTDSILETKGGNNIPVTVEIDKHTGNIHKYSAASTKVTQDPTKNITLFVPESIHFSVGNRIVEPAPSINTVVQVSDAVISEVDVTSQESTNKMDDNIYNGSIQVNGTITHLEDPEVHFVHKQEIEEIDDDVLVVEDSKCDVIVLDD